MASSKQQAATEAVVSSLSALHPFTQLPRMPEASTAGAHLQHPVAARYVVGHTHAHAGWPKGEVQHRRALQQVACQPWRLEVDAQQVLQGCWALQAAGLSAMRCGTIAGTVSERRACANN